MQKTAIVLLFIILISSCNESKPVPKKNAVTTSDSVDVNSFGPISARLSPAANAWVDTLVLKYIVQSDDAIIKNQRNDTAAITWIYDRLERRDNVQYFVIQVGHSFEHNYVTDKWLYIDSLKRNVYEYDLPNDSLIKWPK